MNKIYVDPEKLNEGSQRDIEFVQPVFSIIDERRENGHYEWKNSLYDRFLCDYVGDPVDPTEKDGTPKHREITRYREGYGQVNYDKRVLASYTQEGNLVLVRKASKLPVDSNEAYFVVSADLDTREVTEWTVTDVDFDGKGDGLEQTLQLSRRPLVTIESEPQKDLTEIDPIKAAMKYLAARREYNRRLKARPSIVLTGKGCFFKPGPFERQVMAPISEIDRALQIYETEHKASHDALMEGAREIGRTATAFLEEANQAPKPIERSFALVNND
jgi:hypothetical protein